MSKYEVELISIEDKDKLMENSIGKIVYYFNSHRMMYRYVTEAYPVT